MAKFLTPAKKALLVGLVIGIFLIGERFMRSPFFDFSSTVEDIKKAVVSGKDDGAETWMTVFIHGSFGSTLALLSAYHVVQDQVEGSAYKKMVGKMRKNTFFFRDQPLLERGLVKVTPSFDLSVTGSKKYAAYPLLKAYEEVVNHVRPKKEKHYFYTFGWTGLLSQSRRCLEAIRLYNALAEEVESFRKKGINPKIRILSHSHGGNLVGYLGAIAELHSPKGLSSLPLSGKAPPSLKVVDPHAEALVRMAKRLASLSLRKVAVKRKGQKRWDYKPIWKGREEDGGPLSIDEVVLWGMPVQPETEKFFAGGSFFKNVYHFYSEDDLVQRIDGFSTKQGYSNRRFTPCPLPGSHFVQSRITVDRELERKPSAKPQTSMKKPGHGDAKGEQVVKAEKKEESFWSVLFKGGALVRPVSPDPTHKELWFFCWNEKKNEG